MAIKSIYFKFSITLFGLKDTPESGNTYEASDFRYSERLHIEDIGQDIRFTYPVGDYKQEVLVPRDNVRQILLDHSVLPVCIPYAGEKPAFALDYGIKREVDHKRLKGKPGSK